MYKSLLILTALFIAQTGYSHEGHDEPKQMPAPHGGITRMNENYFIEYVYKTGGGAIYLFTHDTKPAPVAGIEASAFFEVPRKPKVDAKITANGNSWNVEATLPKAHRITLKLKLKDKADTDTLTYVVEPK